MNYICLRDDDTNYFTTVAELQEAYGELWGKVPMTLATIPFVHGSERKILDVEKPYDKKFQNLRRWEQQASADELTQYHKTHPIGENTSLVSELRRLVELGKIEIAQHGVYHRYSEYGAELIENRISFAELRDGKEYLEKVFATTVHTLIPPANAIDLTTVGYMRQLGMDLLTSARVRSRGRMETIATYMKHPESIYDKLRNRNTIRHRYGITYWFSHTYEDGTEIRKLADAVESDLQTCGFASIGTHYRYLLDRKNRDEYMALLNEYMAREDVQFVTAHDFVLLGTKGKQ